MTENKSRNLLDKVIMLEKEKEDLGHRLNDEREATAEARTDAENARTEAQATTNLELEVKNMRGYREKMELAIHARVNRAHTLFVDACRDLGA
jgi:parvulin-like peptidyl-prolyl isomerase